MKYILPILSLILLATPGPALAAAKAKATTIPDFTKGDTVAKDGPHDWTLGPTGARGWNHTANGHSAEARQILVTAVAKNSPAAAVLSTGDVILGVDGKNFSGDARIQFANAIGVAETEKGGGKLRLLRWRAGKSEEVVVTLAVWRRSGPKRQGLADDLVQFGLGCGLAAEGEGAGQVFPVIQRQAVEVAGDEDFQGGAGSCDLAKLLHHL
jgi:hypothetical protein